MKYYKLGQTLLFNNDDYNPQLYYILNEQIKEKLPNLMFYLLCINNTDELYKVFSDKDIIYIHNNLNSTIIEVRKRCNVLDLYTIISSVIENIDNDLLNNRYLLSLIQFENDYKLIFDI